MLLHPSIDACRAARFHEFARARGLARTHGAIRPALVLVLALSLLVAPPPSEGQTDRVYRLGMIGPPTSEGQAYHQTFREALRTLGYAEGKNLILEMRIPDREERQLPALIAELIALKPDVLVGGESYAKIMRSQTTSIPIVMSWAIDPVSAGLAQSLRRPGLNVTGTAQFNDQLPAKHIDLMREVLPRLKNVGMFVDLNVSGCRLIEQNAREAARTLGAAFSPYYVANRTDIVLAYQQMERARPDMLLPCPSSVLFNFRDLLFENAMRLRIPYTSFIVENVPLGVLFAHAASHHELRRRAATYVDRILKGANPAELPIEQPTRFELVVNLATARAMDITVPQSVLLRADRVIE